MLDVFYVHFMYHVYYVHTLINKRKIDVKQVINVMVLGD